MQNKSHVASLREDVASLIEDLSLVVIDFENRNLPRDSTKYAK
jgi:hypothetical protein